jgi:hypothetical protein
VTYEEMSYAGLVRLVAIARELEREPWLRCKTARDRIDEIGALAADNLAAAYRPEGVP